MPFSGRGELASRPGVVIKRAAEDSRQHLIKSSSMGILWCIGTPKRRLSRWYICSRPRSDAMPPVVNLSCLWPLLRDLR